jgi:ketosteroid isomerase-like protein
MPWFPDFAGAVELARRETRAAGRADPVGQYVASLTRGDARTVEDAWPRDVVVYDPKAGEVRGHKRLRQFAKDSQALLAERHARIETRASTVAGHRAVVELLVRISHDAGEAMWPVAIVAESPDDRSVAFRSYFSRTVIDGRPHLRPSILPSIRPSGAVRPDEMVGRHQAALAAGDVEAVVSTFSSDGYYRDPLGTQHRGANDLRACFRACLRDGGIELRPCAVTDDGARCAVEYNCVRWGGQVLPPQAGIAVYERAADGLLAAVRVYDDVRVTG